MWRMAARHHMLARHVRRPLVGIGAGQPVLVGLEDLLVVDHVAEARHDPEVVEVARFEEPRETAGDVVARPLPEGGERLGRDALGGDLLVYLLLRPVEDVTGIRLVARADDEVARPRLRHVGEHLLAPDARSRLVEKA